MIYKNVPNDEKKAIYARFNKNITRLKEFNAESQMRLLWTPISTVFDERAKTARKLTKYSNYIYPYSKGSRINSI